MTATLLAACGDDPGIKADATPIDATPLDTTPTGPRVKVHVNGPTGPVANATVIFMNADDSVVSIKQTDATGLATEAVATGGSITAIIATQTAELNTVMGIHFDDELFIGQSPANLPTANHALTLPALPAGNKYFVYTSCTPSRSSSSTDATVTLSLPTTCTVTNLFIDQVDANAKSLKNLYKTNVLVGASGSTIDLSAETLKANRPTALLFTNVPTGIKVFTSSLAIVDSGLTLRLGQESLFTTSTPMSSTIAGTVQGPDLTVADATFQSFFIKNNGQIQSISQVATYAAYALDVGANLTNSMTSAPTANAAASAITWAQDATGTPANAQLLDFRVTRTGNTPLTFTHRIISAHTAGQQHIPVMPSPQAQYNLLAADAPQINATIAAIPGGYDVLRSRGLGGFQFDDLSGRPTVRLSTFQTPP